MKASGPYDIRNGTRWIFKLSQWLGTRVLPAKITRGWYRFCQDIACISPPFGGIRIKSISWQTAISPYRTTAAERSRKLDSFPKSPPISKQLFSKFPDRANCAKKRTGNIRKIIGKNDGNFRSNCRLKLNSHITNGLKPFFYWCCYFI